MKKTAKQKKKQPQQPTSLTPTPATTSTTPAALSLSTTIQFPEGAHLVGQRPHRGAERSRQAKVRDLEGAVAAHQKVLRLEVPARPATKKTNKNNEYKRTNQHELQKSTSSILVVGIYGMVHRELYQ